MTLDEYDNLKHELSYIDAKISYNFSFLDSRWLERKMNEDDVTHDKDLKNLNNIYAGYIEMQKIVKHYMQ